MRKISCLILSGLCLLFTLSAPLAAADVSLGLAAAWQSSPYKGHDDSFLPIPLLNIEGERFYLHGPDLGVHLLKSDHQSLSFGLAYSGLSFDGDDTDDARLKKLESRDPSADAYLHYALRGDYGRAGLRLFHDILGKSGGAAAEAYYKYPISLEAVNITPGAGLRWDSEDVLDYYYGVSANEARRSGLNEYTAEAGLSPFVSLEMSWQFTERWGVIAAQRLQFLSREAEDSPMVDSGQVFSSMVGLNYSL